VIVIKENEKIKKCIFLTGFHGIGQVGNIATSFLINALDAKRIGYLRVEDIPPFVTTAEHGLITPFEIYKADKLIILRLEFPLSRKEEPNILKTISSWIVENDLAEAILFGGLDASFKQSENEVLKIVASSTYLQKHKKDLPAKVLEPGLYVFGPLAALLNEFEFHEFPALALLPYASAERADPRAAASALKYVSDMYNLSINVKELEDDAKEIELAIEQKMKTAKEGGGVYV
jgi:uncharacterized protein